MKSGLISHYPRTRSRLHPLPPPAYHVVKLGIDEEGGGLGVRVGAGVKQAVGVLLVHLIQHRRA